MKIILNILIATLVILLCLPVVLLPLTTSVPAWSWILLALADVVLIVALFRITPVRRGITIGLSGMTLVSILAIIASQVFAATPLIMDANGEPLPNSIATLEKVNLNGSEQWITIRGQDMNNPILLNLGMGGPGGGGFATRSLFEPLEKYFVVVSWDEPGTGKSYNAVPFSTLNKKRFVEDAHALTLYLRERFNQEKIYVYGVSWTSILGVWLVQEYPELYYAYIGNGQMVNVIRDDGMGYELALNYSVERGDVKMVETLQRNGPPPYTGEDMLDKYVTYLDVLNDYMHSPHYTVIVPIVPFVAPEYGLVDKINHTRGLIQSFEVVYPQLQDVDFTTQAAKLDVPVYIFVGRDDVNAMSSLVEEYFNILEAPHKELIWLNGGHGLDGSNLGQFVDVMINKVLAETYPNK
ncbi:MAG: alpha/beta hydrolase [Anaerolineales bacterium]|uniref:alpha/beta fold hydrolase n=1 Tax=Candidatus Villigracilis proximus TaxID=3140683 RepID=UPI0031367006|nr:alpha/beta hydrolase [Anaerolineales bacterium]